MEGLGCGWPSAGGVHKLRPVPERVEQASDTRCRPSGPPHRKKARLGGLHERTARRVLTFGPVLRAYGPGLRVGFGADRLNGGGCVRASAACGVRPRFSLQAGVFSGRAEFMHATRCTLPGAVS